MHQITFARTSRDRSEDRRKLPETNRKGAGPAGTGGKRAFSGDLCFGLPSHSSCCFLLLLALLAAGGCRHTSSTPDESAPLFPLEEGMTWTFTLGDQRGPVTNVISRVESVEGREVHLVSGTTAYTYELREDGVYRPAVGAYLIKEPLTTGASWEGGGISVTVIATGQEVSVPAGTFRNCVSIQEAMGEEGASQIHVFCPGVGPVLVEQFIDGEIYARGELVGYGPSTDVDDWD